MLTKLKRHLNHLVSTFYSNELVFVKKKKCFTSYMYVDDKDVSALIHIKERVMH